MARTQGFATETASRAPRGDTDPKYGPEGLKGRASRQMRHFSRLFDEMNGPGWSPLPDWRRQ